MADHTSTKKPDSAPAQDVYLTWAAEDREEDKSLRFSLGAAVVVHALLLLITFPQVYTEELEEAPKKDVIKLAPTPRFRPPPIPETPKPPEPKKRRVPIPDPDPDDPEPLHLEEDPQAVVDLPPIDTLGLSIPDKPPSKEPTGPIEVGGNVQAPVRLTFVPPRYTELARRARISGTVLLRAVIDKDGRVSDIKVRKPLPMGLTESAIEAVQQWEFKAATLGGKPVSVFYELSVQFQLQ